MSATDTSPTNDPDKGRVAASDPTGRDRLTWNVLVSWGSMVVTIVLGFVMPRLVDEQLGQVSLGLWDFSWAVVNYITLVNIGVGSNAARYVAGYAVDGDANRLQRIISSAHLVQLGIGSAVVLVVAGIVLSLPAWLPEHMTTQISGARWVLLLLGLSLAAEMYFDAWRGVLTGLHRWDVHNGINTLHSVLSAAAMLVALLAGFGLIGMAAAYFLSALATEILRWRAARRSCPEARMRLGMANRADIRLVSLFGFKNVVAMAGPLVVQQTVSILVTLRLGPALLAVFARPAALVRYLETFIYKFAFVLMPMAGSIQAQGNRGELRRFAIDMCEVGWALAVPGGVFLMVMGPGLVELWMGPDYVSVTTILILAAGGMLATANRPAYRILFGLDRHGTASALSIFIYGAVLVIGVPLLLRGDATLTIAALVYLAGDVLFSLALVPQQLAKVLEMPTIRLLWLSSRRPLAVGVVSATVLSALSSVSTGSLVADLAIGCGVHAVITGSLYWLFILSDPLKEKVRSFLPAARHVAG